MLPQTQTTELQIQTINTMVSGYMKQGWFLVPIPPKSKGPRNVGWNLKQNCLLSIEQLPQGYGVGLAHAFSSTMAFDVDHYSQCVALLAESGIDVGALFSAEDAVGIDSGRPNRGKLLFKMPFGLTLPSKKITHNGETIFELRCATADGKVTVQDVLPSAAIHPDTLQYYKWSGKGHWSNLPMIPSALLNYWMELTEQDKVRNIKVSGMIDVSWDEIKDALFTLDPDCNRDKWRNVGMALHMVEAQTGNKDAGLSLWNEWSAASEGKYPGEREILIQWNSFKDNHPNGLTVGTLFHYAKESGWVRPPIDVGTMFSSVEIEDSGVKLDSGNVASRFGNRIHPMRRFDYDLDNLYPVEYVLDGFLRNGITVAAGETGVGKTSQLVPLCATVAHLVKFDGVEQPTLRRKIVYLTEDPEQVESVLYGLCRHRGGNPTEFKHWFHVIPSQRTAPVELASLIKSIRENLAYPLDNGFHVEPFIVLDTANASIDLDNENDNAEVGKAISAIKEASHGGAILIVTHTSKALSRADASLLAARGAGAWEADANSTIVMFKEDDLPYRVMALKKRRFDPDFTELHFKFEVHPAIVQTPWGTLQERRYSYCVPEIADATKREADKVRVINAETEELRKRVVEFVQANQGEGKYVTQRQIFNSIGSGMSSKTFYKEIDAMVEDELLDSVPVSPEERIINNLHHLIKKHLVVFQ